LHSSDLINVFDGPAPVELNKGACMQGILKAISRFISLALVITLIFSPATTSFADQGATQSPAPAATAPVVTTSRTASTVEQSGQSQDLWIPWVQAGGKLGDERAIGATEALVPLYQTPDGLWFADVHYKDIDGSAWEGNLGGGYRHIHRNPLFLLSWVSTASGTTPILT
jgi:hypothetical protein